MKGTGIAAPHPEYPADLRTAPEEAMLACYVCGVGPKRGDSEDEWAELRALHPAGPRHRESRELVDQPWRRRHVSCIPTVAAIVEAVTGVPVTDDIADAAAEQVGDVSLTARAAGRTAARPFAWIGRTDRARLSYAITAAEAELVGRSMPRPCVDGRCGVCGIGRSTAWGRVPGLSWSDGSPAPLCVACERLVSDADAVEVDIDAVKVAALADMAGARRSVELGAFDHFGFRLAVEVLDPRERHDSDATRWGYRPEALADVRRQVAELRPELLVNPLARALRMRILEAKAARVARAEADERDASTPGVRRGW